MSENRPARWRWLHDFFRAYAVRYLRKHMHALRCERTGLPPFLDGEPAIVVVNHPSWWDPLVGAVLSRLCYADRISYAPIHAAALKAYPILGRVGFFGVEPESVRGGIAFLRTAQELLADPKTMIWLTPQGRFTDPRVRPLVLQAGIGRLAVRQKVGRLVPLAVEYPFWNERTPEALVRFGEVIDLAKRQGCETADDWLNRITAAMQVNCDILAAAAQTRDESRFVTLLSGRVGIGGVYDSWRRWRAWLSGQRFRPGHDEGLR